MSAVSASGAASAAAQMNDPKTVRKAVKTKAGERERREQTERTICLPLFDSNRPSVRPSDSRKISGEEKEGEREREREGEGKGKPEEEERHFNDGWLTFASLAERTSERPLCARLKNIRWGCENYLAECETKETYFPIYTVEEIR